MSDQKKQESEFIRKAEAQVLEHLSKETFGVSELASALHMSRSNLLRKIRKDAGLSASQFIRRVRLENAMELLRENNLSVSEVSYAVGFGSASYFIKCFREHYGYPPGEVSKRGDEPFPAPNRSSNKKRWLAGSVILVLIVLGTLLWLPRPKTRANTLLEKSIAVLPFKNESGDSSNVYFVNGLMESTLNNLQKMEALRVTSRTSVESYRNSDKSLPDIARELNVNYIIEGSGQKVGDQVLLHIQLIEAATDRPIWSEQYNREIGDIFALQNEIARNIADAIQAAVTPEELEQIQKAPTENLVAYDYFLQALEPIYAGTREGFLQAISLLEQAVAEDPHFALAHANMAISYYFLDQYKVEKQYTEAINTYADKALLYDPKLAEGLIAKGMYYLQAGEFRLALPHLEKALEYNPNSPAAVQVLADYYARVQPDTEKYLEYALKGLQINAAGLDSTTQSYTYLTLSNALVQSGFVEEAITYIDKSLAYDPNNYYGPLLKIFIQYAKEQDMPAMTHRLRSEWQADTTRMDILQEVAKSYYFREEYDSAYFYYQKYMRVKTERGLNFYPQEDIKIGVVYEKQGLEEVAARLVASYAGYCERDQSIYKTASTAVLRSYQGDYDGAIAQLRTFSTQDHIQYWILLFIEQDPLIKQLMSHPGYQDVKARIDQRFWDNHNRLKTTLEEKGLL